MPAKKEIETIADIQLLVNTFYEKIRNNAVLGHIFNTVIKDRWPQHLEKMYRFWQTVLLNEHTYFGSPFPPHAPLPIEKVHFTTWLRLWHQTIDSYFVGEKANEAKWRGDKMAEMFINKIMYYHTHSAKPLL